MPIYPGNSEAPVERDLLGDLVKSVDRKRPRARRQVVWCEKCNRLDSVFLGGGVPLSAACCAQCKGEVVTNRSRSAKLKFYVAIMDRCFALVQSAAHGSGDINQAAQYAEYTRAHGIHDEARALWAGAETVSAGAAESPTITTMIAALEELYDIGIVAQELSDRFKSNGRPYLAYRARELERECHDLLDVFELLGTGWEPVNHANC